MLSRLLHTIRLGLRSLAAHQLRSGLTVLGIVLGVASVIVMLSVGEAARFEALRQLEDLGANTIILRTVKPPEEPDRKAGVDLLAYGLTPADLRRILGTVPTVTSATPMREYRKTIRYRDKKQEARIVSITPDFMRQNNIRVRIGRGITDLDEERFDNVCVLGSNTADVLFPTSDPLGKSITMEDVEGNKGYVIVGVTEPRRSPPGGRRRQRGFRPRRLHPFEGRSPAPRPRTHHAKWASFQIEKIEISQITVTVDKTDNVAKTAWSFKG